MALDDMHPGPRQHASDHVFEQLARAILQGTFAKGSALPSERLLVERFRVSRNIARQALHRLAEMGLVEVRQGGATTVLDPHDATDLRVLALFYRLTGKDRPAADTADMIEKQYLQGLSIVETAARRASPEELASVSAMLDAAAADPHLGRGFAGVEERFWRGLARAGKNRIFRMEVGWWYDVLSERPVPDEVLATDPLVRLAFYRELMRRIVQHDHATEYYLAATRPLLDAVVGRIPAAAPPVPEPTPKRPKSHANKATKRAS